MQLIRRKASHWAYSSDSFVKAWRTQRMKNFLSLVKPPNRARIIDLGGSPYMWQLIDHDFNVTLVNLPSKLPPTKRPSGFTFVEGDATNLSNLFEDKSFEIVYANSVIEHVGDEQKQAAFAAEVYRLANSYWVQTPSDRCPIEPHTGIPYYWKLPKWFVLAYTARGKKTARVEAIHRRDKGSAQNTYESAFPRWGDLCRTKTYF